MMLPPDEQGAQSRGRAEQLVEGGDGEIHASACEGRQVHRARGGGLGGIEQNVPFVTNPNRRRLRRWSLARLEGGPAMMQMIGRHVGLSRRRCGFAPIETIAAEVAFQG